MKKQKQQDWKLFKNVWISSQPVANGIWQRKEAGHVVRVRAKDSTTGKLREIFKVLPEATLGEAQVWLEREQERIRAGVLSPKSPQTRFSEFASVLVEEKVAARDIKSAKGRDRWRHTLEHLIAGTTGDASEKFVPGFGDYYVQKLTAEHVEKWKAGIGELITAGDYSPTTANGWLSILRVIMKAAKRRFQLPTLATEDVVDFDTSEHVTYSEEEPNSLTPEEVPVFLNAMRELYPQHFAMTFLGFVTGLRPSSLRPLRRRGSEADVLWDDQRIRVRRSQTLGDEVMQTTKQKRRYPIDLPAEAMAVLRWHVETQLSTPEMKESDLLFPSIVGGFRSPCVLNKPFADVADTIELGKAFTQRGLRRTFNDLARAANVASLVTRSISGHLTEGMQDHYSTVQGSEQRAGISRVIALIGGEHPAQVGSMVGSIRFGAHAPHQNAEAQKQKAG